MDTPELWVCPAIPAAPSNGETESQGNPSTSPAPPQSLSSQTTNNPTQLTPPGVVSPAASNVGQKRTYTEQGATTVDKSKRSKSAVNGPKRKSPRTNETEVPVHDEEVPDSQDIMMDNVSSNYSPTDSLADDLPVCLQA